MSIVTVSYDTKEKKCTCEIDGQELAQCQRIEFYNYGEAEWHFSAVMYAFDKASDMRHSYQLSAKLTKPGLAEIKVGAKDSSVEDLVIRRINKAVEQQVQSFMSGVSK